MGLDEWELLDCHEDDEKELRSPKRSDDQKIAFASNDTDRSISVSDEQHKITGRAADEDTVSQVSGQKLIGDVKKDSPRFCTAAESDMHEEVEGMEEGVDSRRMNMAMEKRQKWGRAAICSFGVAVAATICSVLLGSHSHQQGGTNKQHQKNQICPCE